MVTVTQIEIDEATMIAKNAAYRLAYELSLEKNYGGNIDCCVTKLKLLWMYVRAISCQKEQSNVSGSIMLVSCTAGDTIHIFIGGVGIGGIYTCGSSSISTEMTGLINLINTSQTLYVATLTGSGNVKLISVASGSCKNSLITASLTTLGMTLPVLSIDSLSGGYCSSSNCLSDDKTKKLIAKIRSMCN